MRLFANRDARKAFSELYEKLPPKCAGKFAAALRTEFQRRMATDEALREYRLTADVVRSIGRKFKN